MVFIFFEVSHSFCCSAHSCAQGSLKGRQTQTSKVLEICWWGRGQAEAFLLKYIYFRRLFHSFYFLNLFFPHLNNYLFDYCVAFPPY